MRVKYINNQRGVVQLVGLVFALVAIGVVIFLLIASSAPLKNKLLSTIFPKPESHAAGPTNYYGNAVKYLGLFGQKEVGGATRNAVTASGAYHGSGVIVDTTTSPNKIYFVDSGNSRILGFNGGDGTDKVADLVIGQPSMNVGNCNGDDNLGFKKAPSAATLCLMQYPQGNNTAEQWGANNIDVDSLGNLYISDIYNNRVLEYYQPYSSDKTGGKGDGIADFVWGQNDFSSNGPNKTSNRFGTINPPNNLSLNLTVGEGNPTAVGVSADPAGGVWIADVFNNRVLHFPAGSKKADVVLGQPSMNTKSCNTDFTNTTTMCSPIIARVNPETHELLVIDNWPQGFQARFMVFTPDASGYFQNGQAASRIFRPKVPKQVGVNDGMFDSSGNYIFKSSGFVFNKDKTDYPTGLIWVNEHEKYRTLLLDVMGNVVAVLNAKDVYHTGADATYSGCDHNVYEGNRVSWPNGAIGQDSSNNLYFADETNGRVVRYALPYKTYIYNGAVCPPEGNASLLVRGWNVPSADTLGEAIGLATLGNQLIVGDQGGQYKVWNDYKNRDFGSPSDYTISAGRPRSGFFSGAVDDSGRLWTRGDQGTPQVWAFPITSSTQTPLKDFWQNDAATPFYWADDLTQISSGVSSIAFDPVGKAIYVVQDARILRIKNYNEFNNKLYVDMVIGQTNKSSNNCNQGLPTPNAGTLCEPEQIKFDKLGNLYVIDNTYECHGNRRITVFMADDLKNAVGMFPNLQAQVVFNEKNFKSASNCAYSVTNAPGSPVTLAFNSKNQLVIGNDGYYGDLSQRELKQLWFYSDPLHKQVPDASINLYMGAPADMTFDDQDNLIVRDGTWYRVNMINLCTDPSWLSWLPGVTPVSTCSPDLQLVGYWKFDSAWTGDCSSLGVLDSSGKNNNGMACKPNSQSATAPVQTTSGKIQNGASFNGKGGYFSIPNPNGDLSGFDQATTSLWFNLNAALPYKEIYLTQSAPFDISIKAGTTTPGTEFRVYYYLSQNGKLVAAKQALSTLQNNLSLNTWYHLVLTFDGTTVRFYLNGLKIGEQASGLSISQLSKNKNSLLIGRSNNPQVTTYLNAILDEFRLYNKALSDQDIQFLYSFENIRH